MALSRGPRRARHELAVHDRGDTREVTGAGSPVRLSQRECDLLAALAARPGRAFRREDLLSLVFLAAEDVAVVDTYVHYLRRKLGRDVVSTVRGRGYQLGRAATR